MAPKLLSGKIILLHVYFIMEVRSSLWVFFSLTFIEDGVKNFLFSTSHRWNQSLSKLYLRAHFYLFLIFFYSAWYQFVAPKLDNQWLVDRSFSNASTNQAQPCLASEIRRDWAHSGWYGHRLTSLSDEIISADVAMAENSSGITLPCKHICF